ncbi:helix-turn-helix transcriptional regulator [Nocardia suismassiliense]|uniref:helix-turn-helix transcriptional regulator n=1 Tax=Nocardia suismassiliense TaxID=2077092 RepID=UPI000D1FD722|nr:helix-turn-helix domain-containing protein [Nocardia suismassiliense]
MPTPRSGVPAVLAALSNLDDPVRRKLYEHVIESDAPVSREQAAAAAGIGRTLAAYHLDKLAEAELVTVSYRRPAGRGGPGAGRPAKFYARATKEIAFTAPPRDYELLARLMVSSVEQDDSGAVRTAVHEAALAEGRRAAAASGGDLLAALWSCGYLPQVDDARINLRNCPFHLVAQDHRELVCGLNLRLIEGAIAGSTQPDACAELEPHPDRCCVVVHPAGPR